MIFALLIGSSTIDRSSKNVEFQDKLEKNIIHA